MAAITTLFFDIGGVILTNAWDRQMRQQAAQHFHLDGNEFEERHELVVADFELGRIGLEEYLDRTLFYCTRQFTRDEFKSFIFAQSQPHPEALAIVEGLAHSRKYLLATLNNESLELNRYRIDRFHLRDYFTLFLSSCFLGVKKPDEKIYRLALELTQRNLDECLLVDDRRLNVESAKRIGMRSIQFESPAQLRAELRQNGVQWETL